MNSQDSKHCVACGVDCADMPRYKDAEGRYFCKPCGDKAAQQNAAAAASPAAPPSAPTASTPASRPGLSVRRTAEPPPAAGPSPAEVAMRQHRPPPRRPRSPLKSPLGIAGAVAAAFALLLVLARIAPAAALIYLVACLLLGVGVGIATLVSAFRTSIVQGLLTWFVPFYFLYYVFGISKNRTLMALVPLTPVLMLGVFLLPIRESDAEADFDGMTAERSAMDGEPMEREVAGYIVTVSPPSFTSSFEATSAGTRAIVNAAGQRVGLQSNRPLQIEQWTVGDQHIMIVNDELIVNFAHYGPLNAGDRIELKHGMLHINGAPATESGGQVRMAVGRR